MICPQCGYVLEPLEEECPRCARNRGQRLGAAPPVYTPAPGQRPPASSPLRTPRPPVPRQNSLFSVHPGFSQFVWPALMSCVFGAVFGLILIIASATPNLENTSHFGHHADNGSANLFMFLFGVLSIGVGIFMLNTTIPWLRRASLVITSTHPIPVYLSTYALPTSNFAIPLVLAGRRASQALCVSMRPQQADAPLTTLADIPVFLCSVSITNVPHGGLPLDATDLPATLYLSEQADAPIVFEIGGKCWCSQPGFVRR